MKMIMTRDRTGCNWVEFWETGPHKDAGTYYPKTLNDYCQMRMREEKFKSLTDRPLPRKGSKRQVDVSISVKDVPQSKVMD